MNSGGLNRFMACQPRTYSQFLYNSSLAAHMLTVFKISIMNIKTTNHTGLMQLQRPYINQSFHDNIIKQFNHSTKLQFHIQPKARNNHSKAGLHSDQNDQYPKQLITTANPKRHIVKRLSTSKRLSTLWIQSPKRPSKTTTIKKPPRYQTAQDDPAYSYEFPRHTALLQLALPTINFNRQSPKRPPKRNDSPSTHVVLSRTLNNR